MRRGLLVLSFAVFSTMGCNCGGGPSGNDAGMDAGEVIDATSDAVATTDASDAASDASDPEVCGDSEADPGEVCDDGNTNAGDGCSADCTQVEPNAVCPATGPCEYCGDGVVRTGDAPLADEQCDDGNGDADDGCSSSCQREGSYQCPNPGQLCELCGNGRDEPNEQCDDGGYCVDAQGAAGARCDATSDCGTGETCEPRGGDGCNATCTGVEEFWTCGGPDDGLDACTRCGDGIVDSAAGELCDDGGRCTGDDTTYCDADADCSVPGGTCVPRTADGCTLCQQVDFGYVCPVGGGLCARCGDGVIVPGLEDCDDANAFAGDGCSPFSNDGDGSNDCRIDSGFVCTNEIGTATSPDTRSCFRCGDGVLQTGEACDDGNQVSGDGCGYVTDANLTNDCFIEPEFTCQGGLTQTSRCSDCGNHEVEGFEVCDNDAGGRCSLMGSQVCSSDADCTGVGVCQGIGGDGCAATCAATEPSFRCVTVSGQSECYRCGDGHLDTLTGEECDDGDNTGGDGCNASCFEENAWDCFENPDGTSLGCARCGDGIVQLPIEGCDDRNGATGDGCNACQVESAQWTCKYSPGTFVFLGCADCGDGIVRSGIETCDDKNESDLDGCSSTCQVESASPAWTCAYSASLMKSVCSRCGDGIVQGPTEVCDDGDAAGSDGCSATCKRLEAGFTCQAGPTNGSGGHDAANPATVCFRCGDGILDPGQTCDDGDAFGGDGCSSSCTLEAGYYGCYDLVADASNVPESCLRCGDGRVSTGIAASGAYPAVNETCDDGDATGSDGCSAMCQLEGGGYNCFVPGQSCVRCGNSIVEVGEACDDGNFGLGDGCSERCQIEPLYTCQNFFTQTPMPSVCSLCGDGTKTGLETCDDGNREAGDGCSDRCFTEPGYTCSGASCGASLCGDGVRAGTEECDDGNTLSNDCCNANCRLESDTTVWSPVPVNGHPYGQCIATVCGDGIVQGAETCDTSGNATVGCVSCQITPGYTCTSTTCTNTACGNGAIQGGEQCECDGMGCFYNDGATRTALSAQVTCTQCVILDAPGGLASCGNGVINSTGTAPSYAVEACDDGNTVANDGCSPTCTVEPFYTCKDLAGAPGTCQLGLQFVEVRRFNLNMVQADSLFYDPTTRSFVGNKRVASGQVPLELCLDGTVEYPTTRPRPLYNGAGTTLDGSVYDPATGRVYFLFEQSSNNYSIGYLPLSSLDEGDAATSLLGVSALYQGPTGGTNRISSAGDMTIGEDGKLYVAVNDGTSSSRWLTYASDGNTPRSFITTSAIDVVPAPTSSGNTAGFASAWYVPGWDVFATFSDTQYAPAGTYDPQGSRDVFVFWKYADGTNDGGFTDDYYTQSYLYNASAPIGNGKLFSYVLSPPLDMDRAGQSAATATDGSGFVVCLATGGAGCRLFALACDPTSAGGNASCQGNSPGTVCVPSGNGAPANVGYCTRQAGANDDFAEFEATQTATAIDVLANDVVGEGACYNNSKMVVAIGSACYMGNCTPGSVADQPIAGATVTIGANGTNITYVPPPATCGFVDTFIYWARLGNSSSTTAFYDYATVTVVVGCDCGDGVVQSNEQCDPAEIGSPYACDPVTCRIIPTCGNALVEPGEECDDDGTANGDGCDATCQLEYTCGDSQVDPAFETCDDGNRTSGDGCGATCQVEDCGDGVTQVGLGEECDNGPDVPGDGCDADCLLEPVCGNSVVEGAEECDDGAGNGNDQGCLANCTVAWCGDAYVRAAAPAEQCDIGIPAQAATCTFMCTVNTCGDGILFGAETCDPGEAGTSTACRPSGMLACALAYCGDGSVDAASDSDGDPSTNDVFAEACDDGNTVPGDGCSATCTRPTCGDGNVDGDSYVSPGVTRVEECDDQNAIETDGCLSTCRIPYCGDGFVGVGEECDTALPPGPNGCDATCQIPNYCGDGELGGMETCDYGAANGTASSPCSGTCVLQFCGDGDVDSVADADRNPFTMTSIAEQCDDGGTTSGDGCSNVCVDEWVCGDGNVDPGEQCDDGNTVSLDGCTGCTGSACRDTQAVGFTGCKTEMICGDGVLRPASEQCDDGNMSSNDGCSATCVIERCGDGLTQSGIGEQCDEGTNNGKPGATCTTACISVVCGNGHVEPPYEACDDGNTHDFDGCSGTCQVEIN